MRNKERTKAIKMEPLEIDHFDCECHTPEHSIRFTYDPDDGDLYMSVFLWKWSFWKRVWIAVKYIFGYTSRYGDFDSGPSFEKNDLSRLITLLKRSKKRKREIEELQNY